MLQTFLSQVLFTCIHVINQFFLKVCKKKSLQMCEYIYWLLFHSKYIPCIVPKTQQNRTCNTLTHAILKAP